MTTKIGISLICVSGITAIGLLTPAFADEAVRPFAGMFSGRASFTSPTTAEFHGAGQAMHLGDATNSGFLSPLVPEQTEECEAGWGIPHTNTETLTAANGDQLVLVMNDLACPIGENVFTGTGVWSVHSGTGRFAHATGWGTVVGSGNFNLGTFEFALTGQISY